MAKLSPLKIGVGVGATLLGTYIFLNSQSNLAEVIVGIILTAFGISFIASS
tara:strand:- start:1552 stop:1704 length:153 start_codon:yes stop_codon:yes gene_type:complete